MVNETTRLLGGEQRRLRRTREFRRDDLPTLEQPTRANSGRPSEGSHSVRATLHELTVLTWVYMANDPARYWAMKSYRSYRNADAGGSTLRQREEILESYPNPVCRNQLIGRCIKLGWSGIDMGFVGLDAGCDCGGGVE
ncbi:hypothetical protein HPP92_007567 [Vanilla planifolia]|uniref:Uncharacterized protein n=1 Tax=Vanilla planifolia TaxID=51239 RepID=A0A835V7U4_VANPL|nr:hypothetical protein HPP92_007567 [Vanilla planifolia]